MKRLIWAIALGILSMHLAGCWGWAVRTSSSRKVRVDQEVSGNRGFISGKPTPSPKEPTFTDRKIYRIEVETSRRAKKKPIRPPKEDKIIWGNKGYIFGGQARKPVEEPRIKERPFAKVKKKILQILKPKKTAKLRTYKVKKGDTLQKISRKFYGTTKKWALLYKANRDKLKGPDKVYPGQVLIIPEVSEFKK